MADQSSVAVALPVGDGKRMSATQERMLDAARNEFVTHGIARTSVATIARRAGVSRPTLYRQCGDKDRIVAAVARREVVDFFTRAYAMVTAHASTDEKMVEAFVMGMREAREHPLLLALKEFESDAFIRRLVEMDTPEYRSMVAIAATVLGDGDYPAAAVERALDFALRIVATLLITPSSYLPTGDDDSARAFALRYLVPILHAAR